MFCNLEDVCNNPECNHSLKIYLMEKAQKKSFADRYSCSSILGNCPCG